MKNGVDRLFCIISRGTAEHARNIMFRRINGLGMLLFSTFLTVRNCGTQNIAIGRDFSFSY